MHNKQLAAFFDEFEKIGGVGKVLSDRIAKHFSKYPALYVTTPDEYSKVPGRFERYMQAMEEGVPASRVALGMPLSE